LPLIADLENEIPALMTAGTLPGLSIAIFRERALTGNTLTPFLT